MNDGAMNDGVLKGLAPGLIIIALLWGNLAGCSRSEPSLNIEEPQGRVEQRSVVVTAVDRAEYDAALVSLEGQVVLADCWATWCVPCLEQLPHSMELAERHADEGLAVLTISFDDPSKIEQVQKTLASQGGGTQGRHYISKPGGTQSMDDFEITGGALPHYKLYDRAGKLRRTFALDPTADKQFTTADVAAVVEELLAE
jgi:thiol-disulfide isomerase/thioredoxin